MLLVTLTRVPRLGLIRRRRGRRLTEMVCIQKHLHMHIYLYDLAQCKLLHMLYIWSQNALKSQYYSCHQTSLSVISCVLSSSPGNWSLKCSYSTQLYHTSPLYQVRFFLICVFLGLCNKKIDLAFDNVKPKNGIKNLRRV